MLEASMSISAKLRSCCKFIGRQKTSSRQEVFVFTESATASETVAEISEYLKNPERSRRYPPWLRGHMPATRPSGDRIHPVQ